VGRDVPIERGGWETISNLRSGVNSLAPEWRWEVARDHHGTNHIHESTIHALCDAVGGAGVGRGLFVGNATFFKKWCDCFESFSRIFASFVCSEVNQGSTRLILDQGEPFVKNCKDSCGRFAWDNVDPNVSGGFVDENDEVETMTEGFRRDWTNVGEYSEELARRARMWVPWKRFGCLFSHYTNVTLTEVVSDSQESHAFGRGVGETLMH
jgi:hypothetical protein